MVYSRDRQNHGPSVAVKRRSSRSHRHSPCQLSSPSDSKNARSPKPFPAKSHSPSCKIYNRRLHRFRKVKTMTTTWSLVQPYQIFGRPIHYFIATYTPVAGTTASLTTRTKNFSSHSYLSSSPQKHIESESKLETITTTSIFNYHNNLI